MAGPWDVVTETPIASAPPLTHDGLPARQNADGTHSTELSITVTHPRMNGGRPTNIPSMWNGRELNDDESVDQALKTGRPYQSFASIDEAVTAAKSKSAAGGANAPVAPAPAVSEWDVVAETPPVAAPETSLWKRATVNAREGFNNTIAGEAVNRVESGQVGQDSVNAMQRALDEAAASNSPVALDSFADGTPNPYGQMPVEMVKGLMAQTIPEVNNRQIIHKIREDARRAELESLPSWKEEPTVFGKAVAGLTALGGQVAGSLPSPENLVGGFGPKVVRGAGEGLVSNVAKNFAVGAGENAVAAAATNPVVQFGQASRGEKDGFDAGELAESVVLGAGIGGGLRLTGMVFRGLRDVIARRTGVDPATITPDKVTPADFDAAMAADPEFAAFARANGIVDPADPRVPVLRDKVEARRAEEAGRPLSEAIPVEPGAPAEVARRQNERSGVADGSIDPAATNLRDRPTDQPTIRVDSQGGAFRADEGALAGRDKAAALERVDQKALPAPGRAVPTDEEIARMRPAPEAPPVEAPPKLYGSEERAPQTSTDMAGQRQASEAFTLAQAQRDRAGPAVADSQVAGRPEGRGDAPVFMDEGFPVEVIGRRMVPDAQGRMVEVAQVRRYDPRTGKPDPEGVEYDVPVRQLKSKNYAPEPRMAQDFEARAETDRINSGRDRGKRMDDAQGLDRQTYRQTPPDDNAAGTARASRPDQPDGPHPGPRWSTAEEAMRDFAQRQSTQQEAPSGNTYQGAKATNKARDVGKDSRFVVDEDGHVMSTGAAPVRFADQKQAGKWIIGVGQKQSPDQIFEIANHPSGKGFTVRERGRSEAPKPESAPSQEPPPAKQDTSSPRQLDGPRDVAPRSAPADQPVAATVREEPSFSDRMREESTRVWDDKSQVGRLREGKTSNEQWVQGRARDKIMRQDAAAEIDATMTRDGLTHEDVTEVSRYYRPADGESPTATFHRAIDQWSDAAERDAITWFDGLTEADRNFDTLKSTNPEIDALVDTYMGGRPVPEPKMEDAPFEGAAKGKDRPVASDGNGSRVEGANEPGGGGRGPGQGGEAPPRGGGARDAGTDAGPDGGRQTVIPGAERISDRRLAERKGAEPLKGGNEAPPKGGLFDEDARAQADIFDAPKKPDGGSTFYANPFGSPDAWKGLAESLGFTRGYFRDLGASFEAMKAAWKKDDPKATWAAADLARTLVYTTDGELRAIGKAYDSPAIKEVADMLNAPADFGRGGAVPRAFHEAVETRTAANLNKMSAALKDYAGKDHAGQLEQIKRLVQNPNNIRPGSAIHNAAAAIRKMLDDEFKYLKDAGVDVGEVKGYWPRITDPQAVLRDQGGFLAAASRQYLKDGLAKNKTEADAMANAWLMSIELGHLGATKDGTDFVMLGGTPNANFAKERVFSNSIEKDASNPLNRFYLKDPVDVLTQHFMRTSRRAEWARRFGDDLSKWKDIKEKILAEGNAASLRQVVDLIGSATGTVKAYHGDAARAAMAGLRTWGALKLLPHATFTSISEMAMPAIRSGNVGRFLPDVVRTVASLAGGLKAERALAEDIGAIRAGIGDSTMGQRYFAMDAGSKVQQDLVSRFFRRTGLEQYTNATRAVAINAGQTFIRRLALDVADDHARAKSSTAMLRELGVADAKGFATWLKGVNDGRPGLADLKVDAGHEGAYRTALRRFSDQTILNPNASTRPGWANHPLGSLVFMLQSYQYAFQKQVLNRAGNGLVEGLTGKGYNVADRLTMLTPAAMLPMLAAIQWGLAPVRDQLFGDGKKKEEDEGARFMKAISRGGLFGVLDPYLNMATGARYDRDAATAVAGPAIGSLFTTLDTTLKLAVKNSDNTNTAERNFAKTAYDMAVAPALAAAASYLPVPLGGAVIAGATTGRAREGFTEAAAGPKKEKGGANHAPRAPRRER